MNLPFADELLFRYVSTKARQPQPLFEPAALQGVQRILLMLTTGLGDAVLSTPAISAIRAAMPNAEIQLFCRRAWTPLFVADPDLTGVIPYPGKYRDFVGTIRRLRNFSPELTVVLHGNDPDILPLAYLAGSKNIIRVPTRGTRYEFLLANRDRMEDASIVPGVHYVENRLRILDTLGIPSVSKVPRIHLPRQAHLDAAVRLTQLCEDRPFWILHPFAADPYKSWPLSRVDELLVLARKTFPDYEIILTGSSRDRRGLDELRSLPEGVHVAAGTLDISGMAALMAKAACVVAPDTGILHLAAALGRPVVGMYAPTAPSLVGPRAVNDSAIVLSKPRTCDPCLEKKCPYTPRNCMDQIAAFEVMQATRDAIARMA